ncbi:hypothetical protein U1Q18_039525, partial [Sarracenia purpurea var. burkii]
LRFGAQRRIKNPNHRFVRKYSNGLQTEVEETSQEGYPKVLAPSSTGRNPRRLSLSPISAQSHLFVSGDTV